MTHASNRPASEPVARTVASLDGERAIAFAEAGRGPDCLAIHGTLTALEDMWLGPVPALAEHFRVIAVDRPGHGMSRRARLVDASPWRQATILHDFATAAGVRRPVLVGHSFGATVALAYAMLFPAETAGVVALAPVCFPELRLELLLFGPRASPFGGEGLTKALGVSLDPALLPGLWRAIFLPQAMPDRFAERFPFALAARFEQMIAEGEDAAKLLPALFAMALRYRDCAVPTRLLGGSADLVVNNALHGLIAAQMMPRARFDWLPGLGHMIHHFAVDTIVEAALAVRATDNGSTSAQGRLAPAKTP